MCWKGRQGSVNVEDYMIDIDCDFCTSAKRKNQFRELMNFNNNEVRKLIYHISTGWLSLGKCLKRTLIQWYPLKSYFMSNFNLDDNPTENDPDEKPSREKRLVNAFK